MVGKSRPCDACSLRRVRCIKEEKQCTNCLKYGVDCTDIRVRKKRGPKCIQQKTRDSIKSAIKSLHSTQIIDNAIYHMSNNGPRANISLGTLLYYLKMYQKWFYGLWPILSVSSLTNKLVTYLDSSGDLIVLNSTNASTYALCCTICGALAEPILFLSPNITVPNENTIQPEEYINEAKKIIYLFDLKGISSLDSILQTFFLFLYFVNNEGDSRAMLYLRESITLCQIMGLHIPETYLLISQAESNVYRKVYYTLFISERHFSYSCQTQPILEPVIPYPNLDGDEQPEQIVGFNELIKLFCIPEKSCFFQISKKNLEDIQISEEIFQKGRKITKLKSNLLKTQRRLDKPVGLGNVSDIQKLEIALSQCWIKLLGWVSAIENHWLLNPKIKNIDTKDEKFFSYEFPVEVVKEFLTISGDLPTFVYKARGHIVSCKLLEIAEALCFTIKKKDSLIAFDYLNSIFLIITNINDTRLLRSDSFPKLRMKINTNTMFTKNSQLTKPIIPTDLPTTENDGAT